MSHKIKMQNMNNLYDNLMLLTSTNKSFMWVDKITPNNRNVRIFSQHGTNNLTMPCADECNGIMFEMLNTRPVGILCRPMKRIPMFNSNEHDMNDIDYIMPKHDGIRISTFCDGDRLGLKSKLHFDKPQIREAYTVISRELYKETKDLTFRGYTCDFEYVSPNYMIAVNYKKPKLILLGVRHLDGSSMSYDEIMEFPILRKHLTSCYSSCPDNITESRVIEGLIFVKSDGSSFQIITKWYNDFCNRKNSITSKRTICFAIVHNLYNELFFVFKHNHVIRKQIMQCKDNYEVFRKTILLGVTEIMHYIRGMTRHQAFEFTKAKSNHLCAYVMKAFNTGNMEKVIAMINHNFMIRYRK